MQGHIIASYIKYIFVPGIFNFFSDKNAKNDHPDPTVHTQSAPAYTMNAYGAPPAYGGDTAGPLPNKMWGHGWLTNHNQEP